MAKTIGLVWIDANGSEFFGIPKLEIHIDGPKDWEEIERILHFAWRVAEQNLIHPKIHVMTKEYDDAQKPESEVTHGDISTDTGQSV